MPQACTATRPCPSSSVTTGTITATGYFSGKDAGVNNLTVTGDVIAVGPRDQEFNWATGDAGFSGLAAGQGQTSMVVAAGTGGTTFNRTVTLSSAAAVNIGAGSYLQSSGARDHKIDMPTADAGFSAISVGNNDARNGFSVKPTGFVTTSRFCDSTAGTGTGACNDAVAGIGRMGTGDYFTLYNTAMPAQAQVVASIGSTDATCTSIGQIRVDAGFGAVIYPDGPLTAACTTANTIVKWHISNAPTF